MTSPLGNQPTVASLWQTQAGTPISDELLSWPPDVFALTNLVLTRAEAFRYTLVPPGQWPPAGYADWSTAVTEAAGVWRASVDRRQSSIPDLVATQWAILKEQVHTGIEDLGRGLDLSLCEALLTLHAIADEACEGLGVALDSVDADSSAYRARGRELLVRTGSMARLDPRRLRVLPKVRTPPSGRASFSRYATLEQGPVEARWHKIPARHRGVDLRSEYARILLLPWPLRVRASDFKPLTGPVRREFDEPYAFFEFAPAERIDLDLLDRVLTAAREEAGGVDVVYLPESAIEEDEIDDVEALLHRHGVIFLQAGVRQRSDDPSRFPGNAIHVGVNATLQKGGPLPSEDTTTWWHLRQRKNHRWSLDQGQIEQYHLGGSLHPHVRWWEAMEVPRQVVEFIEVAELTLACLVCEDLAQNDEVAALIRSVGPTIVFPALLDGPQLASRWASRYASGLADDPGSAVLTLTSYGMVKRSRPNGEPASNVIGLWKDPVGGVREIELESGSHAVLLTVCMDRAIRRSADGRSPRRNGTQCFATAVHQIRASEAESSPAQPGSAPNRSRKPVLDTHELSILTSWAEAAAEALAYAPGRAAAVMAEGRGNAAWRKDFGLPELSAGASQAMDALAELVEWATVRGGDFLGADGALSAAAVLDRPERPLESLVRRVLVATVEERGTRSGSL